MKIKKQKLDNYMLQTIGQAFQDTKNIFKYKNIISPVSDAEILFSYLLEINKSDIYLNFNRILTENENMLLNEMVSRRLKNVPIQYITKHQEFMGIDFLVEKGVLIPRSETEILVEKIIKILKKRKIFSNLKIADLGTGTGIIAISIAKFLKNIDIIYAIDISKKALKIAKSNAKKHKCNNKIVFLFGNMFKAFVEKIELNSLDVIVSNPPYIVKDDFKLLPSEIKDNEPEIALNGGIDGLRYYREIIEKSSYYLKKDGFLALEIGTKQAKKIKAIISQNRRYKRNIETIKDYSGIDRVIIAYRKD